ncbi:D-alanyl-D-alanine carboxypeptidase family protein [Bariatricus sp. SGI.161]|uniref:D-alanyl-D-alanine carboxypeptidase family protein n=1 Tax=Lachnospiraceae TaxID=186803 RepID=UPI002A78C5B2|nr:serine hydrolase [Lachnospiraceae bacterium]MDY2613551.1 serine hydrolase [Lachnospiraceae bacterium]MDY4206631.1 serine hydrolase [Lachnospiraceae bacterium]
MKCIGKFGKVLIVITSFLLLVSGCGKKEEVVAAYETENYNKAIYKADLFADNLCVVSEDVDLEGTPDTSGLHAAALFDLDGKKVDFSYHVFERLYPASTTKILTALVALKNADLSDMVTVSANADAARFAADEQTCGIHAGDQLTLSDLLYGLLLYSGNDNAVAIAEYVGGSMDHFVQMMNDEAQDLLATGTHFVNSNGLHNENHYTTAYDLYLIFNECLKYDEFVNIISADSHVASITGADGTVRQITWQPTNFYATGEAELPDSARVIGGKTGTTQEAGNCLILLEKGANEHPYISIVMGADTKGILYQDMTMLINAIPEKQ